MTYRPGEVARRTAIINEMVSNGATSADIAKRLKLSTSSVFAFIEKPWQAELLLGTLARALEHRDALLEQRRVASVMHHISDYMP